jgi:hypothetical protein
MGYFLSFLRSAERKRKTVLTTYQDRGLARLVLASSSYGREPTHIYIKISSLRSSGVLRQRIDSSDMPSEATALKSKCMGGIRQ